MDINLGSIVNTFRNLRVVVIGDPILDIYIEGHCERLCREAPTPVVQVNSVKDVPGGAANVAVNAAALGASVRLFGLIGDDGEGVRLCTALKQLQVPAEDLTAVPVRRTIAKHRLVGDSQILARFDQGIPEISPRPDNALFCDRVMSAVKHSDVIIVSDYGYGTVSDAILAVLANRADRERQQVIADGRDLRRLATLNPYAVKPSYEEVTGLLGGSPADAVNRVEWVKSHMENILDKTSARIAAVTIDRDGALILERGRVPYRTYARPSVESRSTGSGDTFVTAFSLALASGADTPEAAEIASAAAAVVTGRDGTAACSMLDLQNIIAGEEKRLDDPAALAGIIAAARALGQRIVFTNGCFDILHRGHITMLNLAKGLGDILVVGINSDESVRRLKGPGRPINVLEDRIKVLAALSYVDYVIGFGSDSPRELIREIRPDIFAKGGDYTREALPEADLVESLGGVVRFLPLVQERSTHNLIARIRGAA